LADGQSLAGEDAPAPDAQVLAGAEARYRAIVDTAVDAILVIDESGGVISFNPAAERLFGYAAGEVIGHNVRMLMGEPHHGAHDGYLARYRATGERRIIGVGRQVEGLRKDGSTFPLELSVAEWRADGRRYFTGVMRDISERVRAEQLQRLLLGELNHRVKNTLAAVQAVIGQTLRNAPDLETARRALDGRLVTLAKAHDILTRQNWEGADLAEVIAQAIEAHGRPGRFTVTQPDERLTPKAALALSMALHELCTNAAKYGALSTEAGSVGIEVSEAGDKLRIVWRERGGPKVAPPSRRGFGSRMIEGLARDLDGAAELQFAPDGLVCVITAPSAGARAGSDAASG
jgi:PAS domain S-box-containing protein